MAAAEGAEGEAVVEAPVPAAEAAAGLVATHAIMVRRVDGVVMDP